jgi:hypothetical protein
VHTETTHGERPDPDRRPQWISEIIDIAGGDDCFPEIAREPLGKQRILPDGDEVIRRAPDIILGSWCGKRFRPEKVAARPGWDSIPAVRDGQLHEIKSPVILQPGPASVFDGLTQIHDIITAWRDCFTPGHGAASDRDRCHTWNKRGLTVSREFLAMPQQQHRCAVE